ncbi:MAG: EAL domain-containing protein [Alphaproteobacteria bacterium]|nr:EAL domain-containing protein [Alphaproteobacteria bacterium]
MNTRWFNSLNSVQPCWICIIINPAAITDTIEAELVALGLQPHRDSESCFLLYSENWTAPWRNIIASLSRYKLANNAKACTYPGDAQPSIGEIKQKLRSLEEVSEICENMWLIDVIKEDRLICHFLSVVDSNGKIFGHESLVRAINADGSFINGGEIFKASKILRIEHLIDRHLHELAIKCFTEDHLTGFLFINLVPGFIQRPEFYFGGLSEAARHYGMNAKSIVLDCTNSENPRDIHHLKAITQYCRSQGYLVSLDDIETPHTARRILKEMQPDFIKIDMRLIQRADQPQAMATIRELVEMTRDNACSVIAEGVETETTLKLLENADIGLFQGYLFSPPPEMATPPKANASATTHQNRA